MNKQLRIFFISIFLFFTDEVVAFTSHTASQRQGLFIKNSRGPLSAYHVSTPLHYRDDREEPEERFTDSLSTTKTKTPSKVNTSKAGFGSGISMPLIRAIWFNQASILLFATTLIAGASLISGGNVEFSSLHWNGENVFHSFFDWNLTTSRFLAGFLATIPMIFLSCLVEHSDRREASQVNFSTTNMVISLFGRRRSSEDPEATSSAAVMLLSAIIAISTGISEEIVFRGYLPTAIGALTHSIPLSLVGQAALFAFAHLSPKSSSGENKVVVGLQLLNGLWYGAVYLLAGGDILPCIISHMLYDMHLLCETWSVINCQMDYTQKAYQERLDDREELAIMQLQQQAGTALNSETLNFARRFFYAFDYEHKGTLTLSDVQRAVSYAFLRDKVVPNPKQVEEMFHDVLDERDASISKPDSRLSVSEFLRVLFTLKAQSSRA